MVTFPTVDSGWESTGLAVRACESQPVGGRFQLSMHCLLTDDFSSRESTPFST